MYKRKLEKLLASLSCVILGFQSNRGLGWKLAERRKRYFSCLNIVTRNKHDCSSE